MEAPDKDTQTIDLLIQGAYHQAGLAHLEETASHAETFSKVLSALQKAFDARLLAEQAAAAARARVLHVDVEVDALLLAFGDAVAEADTVLHAHLFPAGMERVVGPVGALQTQAVRGILIRFADAKEQRAQALRETWASPLGGALDRYEDVIAQKDRADQAFDLAKANEAAARDAWFKAVTAHLALIAEQYPESDYTRALFFLTGT